MDFKDLRRAWRYRAGRALIESTARLPIPLGRSLYAGIGHAAYHMVARDRRLALDNLRHAFPEWPESRVRGTAVRVFETLVRNIYDVAAFVRWPEDVRARELVLTGGENLERSLAEGRGAILLGNHQGAWELVSVALSRAGYRSEAFARPISEPRLDRWLSEHRKALGITTLPANDLTAALHARRLLKKGGIVAVLLDHRVRRGGRMVEFFGRPARFALGPARLAVRSGAPVLPVRIGRNQSGRHLVEIGAALPVPDPSLSRTGAATELLRNCVASLEEMIRRSPEEWAWIHPRWGRVTNPVRSESASMARLSGTAAVLAIASTVALAACGPSRPSESNGEEYKGPSSAIGSFVLSETKDGKRQWVLSADSAETFDNTEHQTVLSNLHIDFYNSEQKIYSVLTADRGLIEESTNDMSASGNVTVVTADGDTLTTESLEWNNLPGRVKTSERFRLARPAAVLTGTGFESDPGLKNYTTEDVRIDARGSIAADGRS